MITVMRRAGCRQGEMWLHGSTMLGNMLLSCAATLAASLESSRHCCIHLPSRRAHCLRCMQICAYVVRECFARQPCIADRVLRPQLCVTDRWPCWPPVCTLSQRLLGAKLSHSLTRGTNFSVPLLYKKKHLSRPLFFFFVIVPFRFHFCLPPWLAVSREMLPAGNL